jgi:hypothetical protein
MGAFMEKDMTKVSAHLGEKSKIIKKMRALQSEIEDIR